MNALRSLIALLMCVILVAAGCSRGKPTVDTENLELPKPASAFHHGDPLTDTECAQFASQLEAAVQQEKPDQILALVDWEALVERAVADIPMSKRYRDSFKVGLKEGITKTADYARQLTEVVEKGGSFRLLRIHERDGEKRATFRLLISVQGELNYHDLVLIRCQDGQVRAIDMHILLLGEAMSTAIRRLALPLVAETRRSALGRLLQQDGDLIKHQPTWSKLAPAVREQKYEEVLRLYRLLPVSLQSMKWIQILRLQAAANLGDVEYQHAMDDFEGLFPNDPSLDLVLLDSFLLKQRFKDARAAIDRLDTTVQGDPYLDVMRSVVFSSEGKLDQANEMAKRALERVPDLQQPYWLMVNMAVNAKDHAMTAKWLSELDERFDLVFDMIEKVPEYADFVKSPEYKKWLAERKKEK